MSETFDIPVLEKGTYQHYKGNRYEVLGVVRHTETKEKMVLYRGLYRSPDLEEEYGSDPLFVRPYDMFMESVEIDGELKPRFTKL